MGNICHMSSSVFIFVSRLAIPTQLNHFRMIWPYYGASNFPAATEHSLAAYYPIWELLEKLSVFPCLGTGFKKTGWSESEELLYTLYRLPVNLMFKNLDCEETRRRPEARVQNNSPPCSFLIIIRNFSPHRHKHIFFPRSLPKHIQFKIIYWRLH